MWTYVIAFREDLETFIMVRSRKRGGWEMPGGSAVDGETPLQAAKREFSEETGYALITSKDLVGPYQDGFVVFGTIGKEAPSGKDAEEITMTAFFSELPEDLAYPLAEYEPLIVLGKKMLSRKRLT